MRHHYRSVLYVFGVIVAITVSLVAWRASITMAQEGEPAGATALTEAAAPLAPAAPVPGGPGFYSGNGLAFKPWSTQAVPYSYVGVKLVNPDTSLHYYLTPITLPHGATITKFVVWYYDNHGSYDMRVLLGKGALDSDSGIAIAEVDSSGASASNRYGTDTTITTPVVDLQSYSYWIQADLPPSTSVGLVGFRIDYSFPVFLSIIMKQ